MSAALQDEVGFCELTEFALIEATGPDAAPFLHAQLTSDVAGLAEGHGQWSGYCSPKGRLLATLLLWRTESGFLLQLPSSTADATRTRLARYVLRSKVVLRTTAGEVALFGLIGDRAAESAGQLLHAPAPERLRVIKGAGDVLALGMSIDRYLFVVPRIAVDDFQEQLRSVARVTDTTLWHRRDIEGGMPWVTDATTEAFVPQMVNLDLLGGVSYSKGCYPGQEIVARTHYLGRLKQRMHRLVFTSDSAPAPGDSLYSATFGSDQACGTLLEIEKVSPDHYTALAVVQNAALAGPVHFGSLGGPIVEFTSLPYPVPPG